MPPKKDFLKDRITAVLVSAGRKAELDPSKSGLRIVQF